VEDVVCEVSPCGFPFRHFVNDVIPAGHHHYGTGMNRVQGLWEAITCPFDDGVGVAPPGDTGFHVLPKHEIGHVGVWPVVNKGINGVPGQFFLSRGGALIYGFWKGGQIFGFDGNSGKGAGKRKGRVVVNHLPGSGHATIARNVRRSRHYQQSARFRVIYQAFFNESG